MTPMSDGHPTEREWLEGLRYEDRHPEEPDDTPELCPMGCGRTTEDVYGGPCKACWALTDVSREDR